MDPVDFVKGTFASGFMEWLRSKCLQESQRRGMLLLHTRYLLQRDAAFTYQVPVAEGCCFYIPGTCCQGDCNCLLFEMVSPECGGITVSLKPRPFPFATVVLFFLVGFRFILLSSFSVAS